MNYLFMNTLVHIYRVCAHVYLFAALDNFLCKVAVLNWLSVLTQVPFVAGCFICSHFIPCPHDSSISMAEFIASSKFHNFYTPLVSVLSQWRTSWI